MSGKLFRYEKDCAIFFQGVYAGFEIRGFPSSCPRSLLDRAFEIAVHVTKHPTKKYTSDDFTEINRMVGLAREFGWECCK